MSLLLQPDSHILWRDVIKGAEDRCAITLKQELESYLVSLMMRFTNQPGVARQVIATAFMEAMQKGELERRVSLAQVGDHCLILAGLFPKAITHRQVKLGYFVDLGRSAYATISQRAYDLYGALALQFVVLMDILQSIRESPDMLPLEAYELWQEVGSQRALRILKGYSKKL